MKKALSYFRTFLAVALLGAFSACTIDIGPESAETGLKIKVFSPTKVVTGQPMTINGHGFADVKEIVFPDNIVVTNFQRVSGEMIRVNAPAGISAEGGKLILRTADNEVESDVPLTLGKTVVTGFSRQAGETIKGGERITIFGKDLEFIESLEILDPDGLPLVVEDEKFYRKGTSSVEITIPKQVYDGAFVGKLHTIDGREFQLPELVYEPVAEQEEGGHWEIVRKNIWENDGSVGSTSWGGQFRFGLEGTDDNNECIATLPQEIWDKLKGEPFYITVVPDDPAQFQVRVTTGWWSIQWLGADNDIAPWNMAERLIDNGDGSFTIMIDFSEDPAILDSVDKEHILFTGSGFTLKSVAVEEKEWQEGGGGQLVNKKTIFWEGDAGSVSWSGQYRFGLEGHDDNNECIATFPQEIWDKLKSEPFYITIVPDDPTSFQVRVTTGWWSIQWLGGDNDIAPWNMPERLIDNGDGSFSIMIDFSEDPAILDSVDKEHILFTGNGFKMTELYIQEEVWEGGEPEPQAVIVWEGDAGSVSWSGQYRFGLEGHDDNNECIATFPQDVWDKLKGEPFYITIVPDDPTSFQVRVTTGWWSIQWLGGDNDIAPWNMAERLIDNGDGSFDILIDFSEDPAILDSVDKEHILFTGNGFKLTKIYYMA